MSESDNSILCTCGPWNAVIPPPPCPVHRSPEWHDQVREWATTTSTTPVFTEEMIRRAMGQEPCDVSDVPFCGWGDLIPELPTFLGSVWSDTPLDFDGVDDRLTTMQQITPSFSAVIIGKVSDESQEHLRAFAAAHYGTVTTVDLEPEPAPPEDEGVEVDGVRWKIGSGPMGSGTDYVFGRPSDTVPWAMMQSVDAYLAKVKVAVVLGLVDPPALSPEVAAVVEAAKEWRTASIEWGKAARRGEVLGIAADHRDNAVNALIATVDALLAAERASTEEADRD